MAERSKTDIVSRCRELAYFDEMETRTLRQMAKRGRWIELAGGRPLFRQGEPSDSLYFVLSGRLAVVEERPNGDEVIGYIRSGEPVGEMSLLVNEPHSASVYALRDSGILRLPFADFDALFDERADFASALAMSIVRRARHPTASFDHASPKVFAVIASSPSVDADALSRELAARVRKYGKTAKAIGDGDHPADIFAFEADERAHDVLILSARVEDSEWYRFVLRHADRFFVAARRDSRPSTPFPLATEEAAAARKFRLVDLIILHEGQEADAAPAWARAIDASRIFHLHDEQSRDRLARAIAGRTVALVLSGGGARAYAHIGAVKAFRERNVPLDFVCGASMGGIIAACVAMGWDDAEIEYRIKDAFVDSNPLGDHVLPVVALTRGRLVEERLQRHFGDALIENLRAPYFCVSSELTRGEMRIHRRGLLARRLAGFDLVAGHSAAGRRW